MLRNRHKVGRTHFEAALAIARMPALIASGREGQAAITRIPDRLMFDRTDAVAVLRPPRLCSDTTDPAGDYTSAKRVAIQVESRSVDPTADLDGMGPAASGSGLARFARHSAWSLILLSHVAHSP
jgi:hypothetical protein